MKTRLFALLSLASLLGVACRDVTEPSMAPSVHQLAPQAAGLSWETTVSMSAARQQHVAVTGTNGRIYMIGGTDANGWAPGSEAYSPENNTWASIASPGPWCCGGAGRSSDGRIYLAGGENDVDGPTSAVKVYDPVANSWSPAASLSVARDVLAVIADATGRVYAIGGAEIGDWRRLLNSVEVYDPTAGSWAEVAPMATPRWYHAAALGHDGRIYVFGGMSGFTSLSSAEVYDPANDTWTPIASMPESRYAHSAVTGGDGRIYIVGGIVNDGGDGKAAVAYDPQTDSWETVPSMNVGRTQLAASLGLDNKIYAAGGSPPSDLVTGSAESYATVLSVPSNTGPIAIAGADQTLQCVAGGANARLDGSASSDPDGDPLSFAWLNGSTSLGTAATITTRLDLGVHPLTLRVTDSKQASAEDGVVITVKDTKPPAIFVQRFDQFILRIPEGGYKLVARIKADDGCQAETLSVSVSRNRLFGHADDDDGDPDDWKVVPKLDGYEVYLRAGHNYFRATTYTIKSVATDGSSNSATTLTYVNAIIIPYFYMPYGKLRFGR